jgi:hypothetical protein
MYLKRDISTHVTRDRYRRYATIPKGTRVRLQPCSNGYKVFVTLSDGSEWFFVITMREKLTYIGG